MRFLIRAAVVSLILIYGTPADACSCAISGPPCQSYFRVDAVFIGTVKTIAEVEAPPDPKAHTQRLVTFTVERALRGVEGISIGTITPMIRRTDRRTG